MNGLTTLATTTLVPRMAVTSLPGLDDGVLDHGVLDEVAIVGPGRVRWAVEGGGDRREGFAPAPTRGTELEAS